MSKLLVPNRELIVPEPPTFDDPFGIKGHVLWELFDVDGNLKGSGETDNLVTQIGDQFYGDRAAQIQGSALTLTALTGANPSIATTSAAHGLSVGDVVTIAGVTPAGYNGKWAVTSVPSATTFGINVGTALAAGSAFGTATGLSVAAAAGMKLGTGNTGTTPPAKTGAGAALVTYLTNSHQGFDATYPQSSLSTGRVITYKVTYAAGKATSAATPITEVVIFLDFLADATSTAANTIARAALAGIGSKQSTDTLTVTWTHTLTGA